MASSPLAVEVHLLLLLLLLLALTHVGFSAGQMLKDQSLALIAVLTITSQVRVVVAVKCAHVKELLPAVTNNEGYFIVSIPATTPKSSPTLTRQCFARLLGGREQLCAFERSMAASIVAVGRGSNGYDLASPLAYLSRCPLNIELDNKVGAEKASPRPPPPKNSAPSTGGLPRSGNEAPPMGWGFRLFTYFPSYPSSEYPDLGELDWEYQLHV
uniref:Uncharacterized protein n=1 Tax=Ananas comosus var. bracteatus TaxID=296719 RepID=A0A6V7Q1E2_ANACO|nr:unnamed protein product [Ananas comosus var. bracteatus]